MCAHTYIHTLTCTFTKYTHMYTLRHSHHIKIQSQSHTHSSIHTLTHINPYIYTHSHTHACTHTYTHTCTHIVTNTHIHTCEHRLTYTLSLKASPYSFTVDSASRNRKPVLGRSIGPKTVAFFCCTLVMTSCKTAISLHFESASFSDCMEVAF